jgi:acylglycerol lipase
MERITLRTARALVLGIATASFLATIGATPDTARAEAATTQCQYNSELERQLNMPVYQWQAAGQQPRGIVLALHGLVLHGTSYDVLAKTLVDDGYVVYSTDMRGYGRLTKQYPHEFCTDHDCKQKVNYEKSSQDITKLAEKIKASHPGVPLFIVGESLGGHMAVRVASKHPEVVDGIVLSAPAIKAHNFIDKHMPVALNEMMLITNLHKNVSILPYVKKYASDDPEIVKELVHDPMLRKKMTLTELFQSRSAVYKTLSFVPSIRPGLPILVIQGTDDRCVKADAVQLLTKKLHSENAQVQMFSNRGHILIETAHIKPDTMSTLVSWLNSHTGTVATTAVHSQVLPTETEATPRTD